MRTLVMVFLTATLFSFFQFAHAQTATAEPTPVPVVAVPEPAAPPQWAVDVMTTAQELPVIGPIVSKALLYLGIVSSIVTAFLAFLLTSLNALKSLSNFAGLVSITQKLETFQNSQIMYWLKYVSLFNASKKVVAQDSKPEAPKAAA